MYQSRIQDCCSNLSSSLAEKYHQPERKTPCNKESKSETQSELDHEKNCCYCNQVRNGKKTVKKSKERQYSQDLDVCRTRSAPASCPICPIRELCKSTLKYIKKFKTLKKSNSELIALCTKSSDHKKIDENRQTSKQLGEGDSQSTARGSQSVEYNTKVNNKSDKRQHAGGSKSQKQKHKKAENGKAKEKKKEKNKNNNHDEMKNKDENKENDNGHKNRIRGGAAEPSKKKPVNKEQTKAKIDKTINKTIKRTSNIQSARKSIAIKRQPVNPAIGEIKVQNMLARLEKLDIQRMERCPNGLKCSCCPCGPSECAVQRCCNR